MFVGEFIYAELDWSSVSIVSEKKKEKLPITWKSYLCRKFSYMAGYVILGSYIVNMKYVDSVSWDDGRATFIMQTTHNLSTKCKLNVCKAALKNYTRIGRNWVSDLKAAFIKDGSFYVICGDGEFSLPLFRKTKELKKYLNKLNWPVYSLGSGEYFAAPQIEVTEKSDHRVVLNGLAFSILPVN
jgi:hypothetical protein